MAKKSAAAEGVVYSTDPDFIYRYNTPEEVQTLSTEKQRLRVTIDTKGRAGKAVTVVSGFVGTEQDLEALCKKLKNACGVGGSAKDGLILIQGDAIQKVRAALDKLGYASK